MRVRLKTLKKQLKTAGNYALNLLSPKHCPVCLSPLPPGGALICAPCRKNIRYVQGPLCMKCGKPLRDQTKEYCRGCSERMPSFDRGFAWAMYTSDHIRRMLFEVKYHGNAQILDFPCRDFAERIRGRLAPFSPEVLIPVPVHKKRLRERGYNQAEEIAGRLGRSLGLPTDGTALLRVSETETQKTLTNAGRALNLLHAFRAREEKLPYRSVILVDDIYTTGSTAEACTRALRKAGVQTVTVLTLAIGRDSG